VHDVHGFVEQMSIHYPKLDADPLPDRTSSSMGSVACNADLLKIIKKAILLAHPDNCCKAGRDVTAEQEALENFHALLDWKTLYA